MAKNGFSPARLVIKMCVVLVIPVVLMSILPGPSGKPILNVKSVNPTQMGNDALTSTESAVTRAWVSVKQLLSNQKVTGREKVMVYRWQDKRGNLQFSQRPPIPGVAFDYIEIKDKSLSMPKPDDHLTEVLDSYQASKNKTSNDSTNTREVPSTAIQNSGSVKKLINDAQNVQTMLDDRAKAHADY